MLNINTLKTNYILIDISQKIKQYLDKNGITMSYLASQLNTSPQNLSRILKKNTLDSGLIYEVSKILKHDFFADLSDYLTRNEYVDLDIKKDSSGLGYYDPQDIMNTLKLQQEQLRMLNDKIEKLEK